MNFRIEFVPDSVRRRYREQPRFDNGLDRPRLGESADERRARAELRPHTGAVSPSVRDWMLGVCGASYRKEDR
jgi:hypothetical protein